MFSSSGWGAGFFFHAFEEAFCSVESCVLLGSLGWRLSCVVFSQVLDYFYVLIFTFAFFFFFLTIAKFII